MSKFRLPLISPLAGSTWSTLRNVLKGNRIAPKHYVKVALTYIFVIISSSFQWLDNLTLKNKAKRFTFKESPLFIIGHWRSGTTYLHNILTQDPVTGFVTTYQAVFPNNLRSSWIFKTFMSALMPSRRPADNMKISVDLPQEDEYALSNCSRKSYYHFFYFPSRYRSYYRKYVRFESITEDDKERWSLKYRQLIINALLNTHGQRAVLKNPVNTGRMLKLLEIFPDANFVFLMRNPIIVYLSTKNFFFQLFPTLNLEDFAKERIASMILDTYANLLSDYLNDKQQVNQGKIIEIRYEMLVQRPINEIERIYSNFKLKNFHELKSTFQQYLQPKQKHTSKLYSIEKQELDLVLEKLDFAMKHWNYGIPAELEILNRGCENVSVTYF